MTPTTNQKNLFMSMQAEIDELRAAFANLHSDYDIIETDREELRAELAVWIRRADKTWYEKVYTDEIATLKVKLDAANRELDNVKQVEFPKKCEAVANGWRGKVERLEKKLAELESLYASPTCTSDEWLANCPQSVRDLADKIKAGSAPKE